jgi:hypothetical protein
MNLVHLLPVGKLEPSLLEDLRRTIPRCFGVRCEILSVEFGPAPAYHIERQQYHSSEAVAAHAGCGGRQPMARHRHLLRGSLHPHLEIRFWRSANGRPMRRRFLPTACARNFMASTATILCSASACSKKPFTNSAIPSIAATARTIAALWPPPTPWNRSIFGKAPSATPAAPRWNRVSCQPSDPSPAKKPLSVVHFSP